MGHFLVCLADASCTKGLRLKSRLFIGLSCSFRPIESWMLSGYVRYGVSVAFEPVECTYTLSTIFSSSGNTGHLSRAFGVYIEEAGAKPIAEHS